MLEQWTPPVVLEPSTSPYPTDSGSEWWKAPLGDVVDSAYSWIQDQISGNDAAPAYPPNTYPEDFYERTVKAATAPNTLAILTWAGVAIGLVALMSAGGARRRR